MAATAPALRSQALLILFLAALVAIGVGAVLALGFARRPSVAAAFGAAAIVTGCGIGLAAAVQVFVTGEEVALRAAWNVPLASFHVAIDALSAFFLALIFVVSAFVAIYGVGYMKGATARQSAIAWPMLAVLIGSMALVVVARNGVLFLVAWEAMAISSFFLVTLNDGAVEVRNAGKSYLIASHIGTAFLLAFFLLAAHGAPDLDFESFSRGAEAATRAGPLFVLALIGFGTKAGLMPMHVWLPEAHPAAPSHVSALMSGVMIKMGIYGLLRFTTDLGVPPAWWGWTLIVLGLVSGVLGGLNAIASHDFKRMMAYHSVENIGIIALGLGAGLLGLHHGSMALTVLGFGGALFHTLNHALFKALLFLGAGAVVHATGTREIEKMGGLLRRMPYTGAFFAVGALAISGLPPLNGFMGEFVIFRAGLQAISDPERGGVILVASLVGGLAMISALSGGAFMKAFGIVFLGSPRSEHSEHAHESTGTMRAAMAGLAGLCFAVALATPWLLTWLASATGAVAGITASQAEFRLRGATGSMEGVVIAFTALIAVVIVLALIRMALLARRPVGEAVTWDCGYVRPTSRMQYTASSFVEPLTTLFSPLLRQVRHLLRPSGLFPGRSSFESSTPDVVQEEAYHRTAVGIDRALLQLRWLQHGRINIYILYIGATLVALLVWQVGLS
jgi:formate hydrogenlyase subunit 3/multisubunit Na+/H+ antiporter MnhD subunit